MELQQQQDIYRWMSEDDALGIEGDDLPCHLDNGTNIHILPRDIQFEGLLERDQEWTDFLRKLGEGKYVLPSYKFTCLILWSFI